MEKQEESKNEDCCQPMCGRPNARRVIEDMISQHEMKIKALKTLSNMCPKELTREQDEALFELVIAMHR